MVGRLCFSHFNHHFSVTFIDMAVVLSVLLHFHLFSVTFLSTSAQLTPIKGKKTMVYKKLFLNCSDFADRMLDKPQILERNLFYFYVSICLCTV